MSKDEGRWRYGSITGPPLKVPPRWVRQLGEVLPHAVLTDGT